GYHLIGCLEKLGRLSDIAGRCVALAVGLQRLDAGARDQGFWVIRGAPCHTAPRKAGGVHPAVHPDGRALSEAAQRGGDHLGGGGGMLRSINQASVEMKSTPWTDSLLNRSG